MGDQSSAVEWRDGQVPVSTHFDDPYFSLEDGLAETRHVFLDGNSLPDRFYDGFRIAELGFGTGLNLLAAFEMFQDHLPEGQLIYTGFEAYPMGRDEAERALAVYGELDAEMLLSAWDRDGFRIKTDRLEAEILIGDAREVLPAWDGRADAWFLDGFSPAKNPELWEPALMREVARHTVAGGSFATYTAAGHVRRALDEAGFDVVRQSGFGRKRHMSAGTKR